MQTTTVEGGAWSRLNSAKQEPAPRDLASRSQSGSSSLFSIGNDSEVKKGYQFDSLLSSVSGPLGDHLASKDQNFGSAQQGSLQIPTSMDPVMGTSQGCLQGTSTTLWLQQEQNLQPALTLSQGDLYQQQQTLDSSQMWVLSSQGLQQHSVLDASSAQLQLQALQQGNSSLINLSGLSVSLQGSSMMPMQQQQGINATINGVPVVLQLQNTAAGQGLQQLPSNISLQPMQQQVYVASPEQQVYVTPAVEQQTLMVNTSQVTMQQAPAQVTMQPVQQQQVLASSAPNATASTDPVLQLQLQQLQDAVQQLTSQTAAVQRVLCATQVSQPQASQAQTVMISMEGNMPAATSPTEIQSMMSAQMTTGTANSPVSSHSGRDSMSSVSWHGLEPLSNSNTSSPSFGAMHQHRGSRLAPAASAGPHGPGSHSNSMLCIVSAPEMPPQMLQHQQQQQLGQGGPGFYHAMHDGPASFSQGQVVQGSGGPAMMNHSYPAGARMGHASTGTPMNMPQRPAGGAVGGPCPRGTYTPVYDQGPGMLMQHQRQPGRISAPTGSGAYMQRPFRGNRPFSFGKGRQHSQVRAGTPSGPLAAAGAGRVTPISSTVSSNPANPTNQAPNPGPRFPGPWGDVSLEDGLKQLWSAEELAGARGGRLYNVQQLAWHPVGDPDPTPQDMYNFQKLKRMVQKLDAVHKTRVKLIKRIHAVADHGECDLKGVYREVRGLIGEMLHDSAMMIKSLEQSRVTGLVRLGLMLQEALKQGPNEGSAAAPSSAAAVLSPIPAQPTVQVQCAVPAQAVQCS